MAKGKAISQKGWQGHNPTDHEITNENEKRDFFREHTFDKKGVGRDHNGSMEDRWEPL